MTKYKCKKCNFTAEGYYWNETLEGQVMGSDEYVPIQDPVGQDLIWLCPSCMNDVEVKKEVK